VAALMILVDRKVSVWIHGANFFLFSGLLGIGAALLSGAGMPDGAALRDVLWWFVPVTLLVTLPAGFATIYGPTRLNPGLVGLLFMVEVAVASISAAILTDEAFGLREAVGVTLIMMAGLLEPLREMRR
jgi:drug/metabolite transporter (DMT)-like permease